MNIKDILALQKDAQKEISASTTFEEVEKMRIKYLSRKGLIQTLMSELKNISKEEKPLYGKAINDLKNVITKTIETLQIDNKVEAKKDQFDTTQPGQWQMLGSCHPITQITDRIISIFQTLGFTVEDGPDIETVFNNFDALNTPEDHPSRDEQDTFYLKNGDLLRCHTSPVQVRYMKNNKPPIRIISPGRCYRRDTPDATHSANFHQLEGLYIDDNVSLADLKGTLSYFAKELIGPNAKTRFRPHYFPFTEPSVEVDIHHDKLGWIEVLGAGIVDPNVLTNVGYDSKKYSGFAFGMGIERIAMILYGISDIRHLYENDKRFLMQF